MENEYHPYAHMIAIEGLLVDTLATVIAQAPASVQPMLQSVLLSGGIASSDSAPNRSDPLYAQAELALEIRAKILARVATKVAKLTARPSSG